MRILIVDDDNQITEMVREVLKEEGHAVDISDTGEKGEELAESVPYDLIILDIILPGRNGIEICRSLRQKAILIPILILSGKGDLADRVRGLDAGADDYLVKPFALEELCAKTRSLLRKGPNAYTPELKAGNLVMDTVNYQVWCDGKEIVLTKKEYAILECLMCHPNAIVSRTMLEQHAWNIDLDSSSNVIEVNISTLRSKLSPGDRKNLIQTVKGRGYRLKVN